MDKLSALELPPLRKQGDQAIDCLAQDRPDYPVLDLFALGFRAGERRRERVTSAVPGVEVEP